MLMRRSWRKSSSASFDVIGSSLVTSHNSIEWVQASSSILLACEWRSFGLTQVLVLTMRCVVIGLVLSTRVDPVAKIFFVVAITDGPTILMVG